MSVTETPGAGSSDTGLSGAGSSDAELVVRVRAADEQAVAEVYLRHHSAMVAYARCISGDPHIAEDLASEAFTRTLRAIRGGGGPTGAWRPYLYTAVRNLAADWARAQQRAVPAEDLDAVPGGDGGDAPADHVTGVEERAMIAAAFGALPERQQTVLWHAVVEGEPHAQVAAVLGTTPGNVGVLVFRARESLREAYLAVHATTECAGYSALLAQAVRGRHGRRTVKLREHLDRCARCRTAYAEMSELNRHLRVALLPAALLPAVWAKSGLGAAAAGAGSGAGAVGSAAGSAVGKAGLLHRIIELPTVGVAVAGSVVLALVATPIVVMHLPDSPGPQSRPPAAGLVPSQTVSPTPVAPLAKPSAPRSVGHGSAPAHRPKPSPTKPPARSASAVPAAQQQAIQAGRPMIAAANRGRTANDLPTLRTDSRLNRAAATQALQMAKSGTAQMQFNGQGLANDYGYPGQVTVFISSGGDPAAAATTWFGKDADPSSAGRSASLRAIGAACAPGRGTTWCSLLAGNI